MPISKDSSLFKKLINQNALIIGKVIDLGCGKGGDIISFAKAGFECIAVDKSRENIENLEEKTKKEGYTIKAVQSNIEDFNLEPDTYDLVSSQYTLHFLSIETSKRVIEGMIRACKNGGTIIFTLIGENDEWKEKWSTWKKDDALHFIKLFSVTLRNIIIEEGYDQTKIGTLKYWHVMTFVLTKNDVTK